MIAATAAAGSRVQAFDGWDGWDGSAPSAGGRGASPPQAAARTRSAVEWRMDV
jgi:hypothetical protein